MNMIPPTLITIIKNNIDNTLKDLKKELENHEKVENNIQLNMERLRNLKNNKRLDSSSSQSIDLSRMLNDTNNDMRRINQRTLREIDSKTAIIASYLALLMDECIENYNSALKFWIRNRLTQLDEVRELKINGASEYLIFPAAIGILTPYIIKTRLCDDSTSRKLVTIRNLIRKFSEPSY